MKKCVSCEREVEGYRTACQHCGGQDFIQKIDADDAMGVLQSYQEQAKSAEYVDKGEKYFQQGLYDKAVKEITKALEINPKNATAHGNIGVILHTQGKSKDAIPYLEKALELNPHLEGVPKVLAKAKDDQIDHEGNSRKITRTCERKKWWQLTMSLYSRLFGHRDSKQERDPYLARTDKSASAPKMTIQVPVDEITLRVYYESRGGTIDQFYATMSRNLIEKHGSLMKVDYVSPFPKSEIWLFYEDGTSIISGQNKDRYDINFLSLGCVGEGSRYARSFLKVAGANLTLDDIESIKPGTSIQLKEGNVHIVRKEDQLSEDEADSVNFLREVEKIGATYRLYTSPDDESAKAFLGKQNITASAFFVVVKTPTSYLGKDCVMEFDASPLVKNLGFEW